MKFVLGGAACTEPEAPGTPFIFDLGPGDGDGLSVTTAQASFAIPGSYTLCYRRAGEAWGAVSADPVVVVASELGWQNATHLVCILEEGARGTGEVTVRRRGTPSVRGDPSSPAEYTVTEAPVASAGGCGSEPVPMPVGSDGEPNATAHAAAEQAQMAACFEAQQYRLAWPPDRWPQVDAPCAHPSANHATPSPPPAPYSWSTVAPQTTCMQGCGVPAELYTGRRECGGSARRPRDGTLSVTVLV